ncbi:MAG: hypothetical protein HC833_15075 [Leptolyngbyaceae cyanobacterium RM1_406_9]|nr:hypothetical protein [Leptolyngbyaceae cyanobacterium RM1_406_9]
MTPIPSPLPKEIGRRGKATLVLREYAGLVTYGLRGRFFPSESRASLEQNPKESAHVFSTHV